MKHNDEADLVMVDGCLASAGLLLVVILLFLNHLQIRQPTSRKELLVLSREGIPYVPPVII
jgi:hypothetical protein